MNRNHKIIIIYYTIMVKSRKCFSKFTSCTFASRKFVRSRRPLPNAACAVPTGPIRHQLCPASVFNSIPFRSVLFSLVLMARLLLRTATTRSCDHWSSILSLYDTSCESVPVIEIMPSALSDRRYSVQWYTFCMVRVRCIAVHHMVCNFAYADCNSNIRDFSWKLVILVIDAVIVLPGRMYAIITMVTIITVTYKIFKKHINYYYCLNVFYLIIYLIIILFCAPV